jgi:vanillate O-demethylase ferredoxin subunit
MTSNTLLVKVERIVDEATDIKSFRLVSADGHPLPAFTPGSHVDVHIGGGLIRQYSLCGATTDTGSYLIAVKKEAVSRGGSDAMHHRIQVGDQLSISAPRNHFGLQPDAAFHLLVGGGIGITPLLGMARHLAASGANFALHYFSRSLEHAAFHNVFSAREFSGKVACHYALDVDAVAAQLTELLAIRPAGAHLYYCGPLPFMRQIEAVSAAAWPADSVHMEHFAADPAQPAGVQDEFEVTLARSGGTYRIAPDQSITEALAAHGIIVATSCEQGVCGTCLTPVLEGTPDHRDLFLTQGEQQACDQMALCVSRSKSARLVLDL